jgi:hypothetical protein
MHADFVDGVRLGLVAATHPAGMAGRMLAADFYRVGARPTLNGLVNWTRSEQR